MPITDNEEVQKLLSGPMPWIGLYVAAASLACTLAMAADVFHGFQTKKLWFPSKYFSLNAATLTLLAVSLKLPVDLTTWMYTVTDRLAKVSSLALMSTSMANFLTSLGIMQDKDILMNVTALGILVITVTANVFIQIVQLQYFLKGTLVFVEEVLEIGCMFVLLVMFIASALMIASSKLYMETKYHEMHNLTLDRDKEKGFRRLSTDKLRLMAKKYWVMAETSSPQFVIARSLTCTSSGVISLLALFVLLEAEIRMYVENDYMIFQMSNSEYGWSTRWIIIVQTIGVIVGTIAPASRWFVAIRFGLKASKSIKKAFVVEGYWIQKLLDWKQSSLSSHIQNLKCRKFVHDVRGQILKLCIGVQSFVVLSSKIVLLISVLLASPIVYCLSYIRRLKKRSLISDSSSSRNHEYSEARVGSELDIGHCVMLLEGESELPIETLKNICKEVDKVIEKGKMNKPKDLLKLLHKSCNFDGVIEFDSQEVENLHSQQLPYCWSLPVVTLTSIALALPNIKKTKATILLNSVTEGLTFVKRIDKIQDRKGDLTNIRKAADFVWVGVELYRKWQGKDLNESSLKGINSKEILQELSFKAEATLTEFLKDVKGSLTRNPLHWPANVIAANTMYRISNTILMDCDGEYGQIEDILFERISIMIADILSASLTNLVNAINLKCFRSSIEEREKSVRKAALLLGETEEILALLHQRELPRLVHEKASYIDDWRSLIKEGNMNKQETQLLQSHNSYKVFKSRKDCCVQKS